MEPSGSFPVNVLCKTEGIKSKSKHYRYKKAGETTRIFPNLLLSEMQINGPTQCSVSNMTAFYLKGTTMN